MKPAAKPRPQHHFKFSRPFVYTLVIIGVCVYALPASLIAGSEIVTNLRDRPYIEAEYSQLKFTAPMQLEQKQWVPGHFLANAPTWDYAYKPLSNTGQIEQSLRADLSAAGYKEISSGDSTMHFSSASAHLDLEIDLPQPLTTETPTLVVIRATHSR